LAAAAAGDCAMLVFATFAAGLLATAAGGGCRPAPGAFVAGALPGAALLTAAGLALPVLSFDTNCDDLSLPKLHVRLGGGTGRAKGS
jgi:hypothetical protein